GAGSGSTACSKERSRSATSPAPPAGRARPRHRSGPATSASAGRRPSEIEWARSPSTNRDVLQTEDGLPGNAKPHVLRIAGRELRRPALELLVVLGDLGPGRPIVADLDDERDGSVLAAIATIGHVDPADALGRAEIEFDPRVGVRRIGAEHHPHPERIARAATPPR